MDAVCRGLIQPRHAARESGDLITAGGDQGNDDFFLIVEVAKDVRAHGSDHVGQNAGAVGNRRGASLKVLMKGDGGLEQTIDVLVDDVVVAVEQIDAMGDARFDPTERREILTAFDAVVHVQMLQELLHRRDQPSVQAAQVRVARPPVIGHGDHVRMLATEVVVNAQPEARHFGQGRFAPTVLWKVGQKHSHVVGQAGAHMQMKRIA